MIKVNNNLIVRTYSQLDSYYTTLAAKQLVARLLTVDPQQRIVSSECLRDEWFAEDLTGLERLYLSTESDVPSDPR